MLKVLLALLALKAAVTVASELPIDPTPSDGGPGYDSGSSYGGGPSYRYGGYSSYGYAHLPLPSPPLDMIDLLYSRVEDINTQNAFLRETVESLEAQLTIGNTVLQKLTHIVIPYLQQNEVNQDRSLDDLEAHYGSLEKFLDDVNYTVSAVSSANAANADAINGLIKRYADALRVDTAQDGDIAELLSLIRALKGALVWYMENEFTLFNDRVEQVQAKATSTKLREFQRVCETGSVTVTPGSLRFEYVFRTEFQTTPQILTSFPGFVVDLPEKTPSYGYGYPPPPPPKSIGGLHFSNVNTKSVTVNAEGLHFGGVQTRSVLITFQACSIPPSTVLNPAY